MYRTLRAYLYTPSARLFFGGGWGLRVFLQEKSHRTGRLRTEWMVVHCSVADISLRMVIDSFGWQLKQLCGSSVPVFRATREERRPPCENLHSLLKHVSLAGKSPVTLSLVWKEPNNCGFHLPRERVRHPSTVGDLESQLLDYDSLIHLSALVVSAAWVKQSFGAEQRNYQFLNFTDCREG